MCVQLVFLESVNTSVNINVGVSVGGIGISVLLIITSVYVIHPHRFVEGLENIFVCVIEIQQIVALKGIIVAFVMSVKVVRIG